MNHRLYSSLLLPVLAVGGLTVVGCTNQTEGQRTMQKGDAIEDAGAMIRRGELLVSDGKALEARGRAVRDQGDTITGDKLIGEGRSKQAQGQELIEQGRRIRDKND
jgi:hypothetical protein